jgi:hypothetical protein
MNTLSPTRRTTPPRASTRAAKPAVVPAPHIFDPAPSRAAREAASLFDLKKKPGYYNADAKVALLRREKQPPHDELLVDFSGSAVELQLAGRSLPLVAGSWAVHAVAGGQTLTATGPWNEVCWHREDLCDYLEIEQPLSGGWRIERHLLLARNDRFLFLADVLLGPGGLPAEIAYAQTLPIARQATAVAARETREVSLQCKGRPQATVLPLGLGEWRSELCHAELAAEPGQLNLRQAAQGRSLFAPLWIDLDPRRQKRPVTWRRLSVGENLGIVPRDVAVGYRVQAGDEQWLVYRSLTPIGNRSILGHNTAYSFVCGRIKKDGNFDPIIEIE